MGGGHRRADSMVDSHEHASSRLRVACLRRFLSNDPGREHGREHGHERSCSGVSDSSSYIIYICWPGGISDGRLLRVNEGVAERSIHAQRWRGVEGIDGVGGRGSRHLDVQLPMPRASVSSKGLAGRWRCGSGSAGDQTWFVRSFIAESD